MPEAGSSRSRDLKARAASYQELSGTRDARSTGPPRMHASSTGPPHTPVDSTGPHICPSVAQAPLPYNTLPTFSRTPRVVHPEIRTPLVTLQAHQPQAQSSRSPHVH